MISTVVSLAKRAVNEEIPGMMRSTYHVDPMTNDKPSILHVPDSYFYKPDIDGGQDRVLVQSEQIVESIVHMHLSSQLLYRIDQHPAVFAVPNREIDSEGALSEFKSQCKEALKKQRQWFVALVRMADDDWQHLRKHKMISDIQRTAAIELGLKREWLDTVHDEEDIKCPFCGSGLLDPMAPICPACGKIHNPTRMAELESRISINPVTGKRV